MNLQLILFLLRSNHNFCVFVGYEIRHVPMLIV